MNPATYEDFLKLDLRVGTVLRASPNPKARVPALELEIDFGPSLGVKRSSAQITRTHRPEELPGLQVIAVVNLPPKVVAGVLSEVLVLGAVPIEGIAVLLGPQAAVSDGSPVR
jgi:tRNA-binding protein